MTPLALTDHQLALVRRAAAALPPAQRDGFLRVIAARLAAQPTDAAVAAAVNIAMDHMPSAEAFLCDAAPTKEQSDG
jgi:hypothetical protein